MPPSGSIRRNAAASPSEHALYSSAGQMLAMFWGGGCSGQVVLGAVGWARGVKPTKQLAGSVLYSD